MSSASSPSNPARLEHVLSGTPVASSSSSQHAPTLESHLRTLSPLLGPDQSLPALLLSLASACASIAQILRASAVAKLTSSNEFGDVQLNVDVATHEAVLQHLRQSGVCATASSEEDPVHIDLSSSLQAGVGRERVFSVGFDPLDGSSIIDANFSVGSIFSVWAGREMLGQRVSDQAAAAIAMYGPRTSMVFALARGVVFEATLAPDGRTWLVSRESMTLKPETKTFAPANLRCTAEDAVYRQLVQYYIDNKYTLRYSGGLVPDVYHALIKGSGVFLSPVSAASPAKLRLVYEVAALAHVSLCAGGKAVDQHGHDLADAKLTHYDERSGLIVGSRTEVERYQQARKGGK